MRTAPRFLLVVDTPSGPRPVELSAEETVVGRDAGCQVSLADQQVSRRHATLRLRGADVLLVDLGSGNGTWIGDVKVVAGVEHTVPPGVTLRVGTTQMIVERPRAASGSARWMALGAAVVLIFGGFFALRGREDQASSVPGGATRPETVGVEAPVEVADLPPTVDSSSAPPAGEVAAPLPAPRATRDALAEEFERALAAGDFRAAARSLNGLGRPRDLSGRLQDAERADVAAVRSETERLSGSEGREAALSYLRTRLERHAAVGPAAAELMGLAFDLSPEPVVAVVGSRSEVAAPMRTAAPAAGHTSPVGTGLDDPARGRVGQGRLPTGDAQVGALLRARLDVLDTLLAERRIEEGRAGLAELLVDAEAARAFSLVPAIELRLREVANFDAFVAAAAISNPTDARGLGDIPRDRGKMPLLRVDAQGLHLGRPDAPELVPWRAVSAAQIESLVGKLALPPAALVAAAAVLFQWEREAAAEGALMRAHRAAKGDEAIKAALDQVLADSRDMELPVGGFLLEGDRWLSPQQVARARLDREIRRHVELLASDDPEKRRAAFEALDAFGPAAAASLGTALDTARTEALRKLEGSKTWGAVAGILTRRQALDEARKRALELIFDTTNYPYPYAPGRGGTPETLALYEEHQPIVDQRTKLVEEAWRDPQKVVLSKAFRDALAKVQELDARLAKLSDADQSPLPSWAKYLPEGEVLTVATLALSVEERDRRNEAILVMAANEAAEFADDQDKAECRITNEYRTMLGRRALRLHRPMVVAARDHSRDMERLGFFAHQSPVAGKASPYDRLVLAGMQPTGAGENLAIAGSPAGAHSGWLHSPGHHRNILNAGWRIMGVSYAGRKWTQIFAVADANEKK